MDLRSAHTSGKRGGSFIDSFIFKDSRPSHDRCMILLNAARLPGSPRPNCRARPVRRMHFEIRSRDLVRSVSFAGST